VTRVRRMRILMVEDNRDDVELVREAFKDLKTDVEVYVAENGVEAMSFLRREGKYANAPHPHIVVLDLNLPKKNGHEVLAEIKSDEELRRIPVVIMTTSDHKGDIKRAYDSHANCYIVKAANFNESVKTVKSLQNFWFSTVELPER
jgi:CheY-like chemotaxis protein